MTEAIPVPQAITAHINESRSQSNRDNIKVHHFNQLLSEQLCVLTVSKNITLNLVRLVLLVANYIWHGGGYVKLFGRIS